MRRQVKVNCYGAMNEFRFFFFISVPVFPVIGVKEKVKEKIRKENAKRVNRIITIEIRNGIKKVKEQFRLNSYGASFGKIKTVKYEGQSYKI